MSIILRPLLPTFFLLGVTVAIGESWEGYLEGAGGWVGYDTSMVNRVVNNLDVIRQ